jgi:hypothetical protein
MRAQEMHIHAVVRAANDAVRFNALPGRQESYLCECVDLECSSVVPLVPGEYDARRLELDPRIVHETCSLREGRSAVLAQNRLLRATMAARLSRLRAGAQQLGRLRGR